MTVFYVPDLIDQELITLDADESKHATRVLRLQPGARVFLSNGIGGWFTAEVETTGKHCQLRILEKEQKPSRSYHLSMAVAPTKNNNRFEWFVEKATEIGLDHLLPFYSQHSERSALKTERIERVVTAAVKQSLQAYRPVTSDLCTLEALFEGNFEGQKFIAHCQDSPRKPLKSLYQPGENALVLIGPEGDFSPAEVEKALQLGFEPISLGSERYRTETAALMACHTIQLLNQ